MRKILLIALLSFAHSVIYPSDHLKPVKTNTPPVIDGKLDDAVWATALSVSGFKSFSPDFGKEASGKTLAYASYDSEHLYFAFYCFDLEPEMIKSSISSRDNIRPDDWVCINLDTFNDHQSLYAFYVNPAGIQADSRFAAGVEDFSADYVWYSAGQIQPDGYSVEISIPLHSIRFAEGETVTMSLFFERYISRFSEHVSYPELDPAKGMAFLTQMTPLIYKELKSYTLLELLPAFTFSRKYNRDAGDFLRSENKGELSLTAKYGFTSDLILDGTYNPDFSQIEADAGQVDVNLRYALFYPEKRSFFQEGSEIYNIAATQSSEVDPVVSLIHTRTIVDPIAGFKLSGKVGKKSTVAAMYTVDELSPDQETIFGNYAHSPVFRYKTAFKDDSYVGILLTDREMTDNYNRVYGFDGMVRLSESSTIMFNGFFSDSKLKIYQKKFSGNTFGVNFNSDTRNLNFNFSAKTISENFQSEPGYLTRTGISYVTGFMRPKFYPESNSIQRIEADIFSAQIKDHPSGMWETSNYLSTQIYFLGSLFARAKYSYATEIYGGAKFNTGGILFSLGGLVTKRISFSVVYKKGEAIYYPQLNTEFPYQGNSNQIVAYFIYQPSESVESYSSFIYYNFYNNSNSKLVYEYPIFRERLTYQPNKYLFFRGVVEYNKYKRQLITDFLISFTYVPGTVIHLGYGALYQRTDWNDNEHRYMESGDFHEAQRGFFLKMSYLWRL